MTGMLLTVNLLMYAASLLVTMKLGAGADSAFTLTPGNKANVLLGSAWSPAVMGGQFWRLITYAFLHGGLMHIIFNSLALVQVGRLAEEAYGGAKYFCVYIVTAITGGLTVYLTGQNLVGASGAIFGLIGAMAVYGYKRGGSYGDNLKKAMVQWIIYSLIISLILPGVSLAAHVGGLLGGAGLGWFLDDADRDRQSQQRTRLWQILAGLALVLVIAAFALTALSARAYLEAERVSDQQNSETDQASTGQMREAEKVRELSLRVVRSAIAYTGYKNLNQANSFDQYRTAFGETVTTLEKAPVVDAESSAVRQHLVTLLRQREAQLQQVSSRAEAAPRLDQYNAFRQSLRDYSAWMRRKRNSLGETGRELLPDLDLGAETESIPEQKTEKVSDGELANSGESDRTDSHPTVPKQKTQEKK